MTPVLCGVCGTETRQLLRYCDTCRNTEAAKAHILATAPRRPEHAPGHPLGAQAGPPGMAAEWCLIEGCGWRDTRGGAA